MDEMVFLSILSNPFDFYRSTSYLYLWGYQFIVLAKNKAIVCNFQFVFTKDEGSASSHFGETEPYLKTGRLVINEKLYKKQSRLFGRL